MLIRSTAFAKPPHGYGLPKILGNSAISRVGGRYSAFGNYTEQGVISTAIFGGELCTRGSNNITQGNLLCSRETSKPYTAVVRFGISAIPATSVNTFNIFHASSINAGYIGIDTSGFLVARVNSSTVVAIQGSTNVCDGKLHTAVFLYKNGEQYLFLDGNLEGSSAVSSGTIYVDRLKLDYSRAYSSPIVYVSVAGLIQNIFSYSVARSLSENPWQLFTPQKQIIYFDGAVSGGATANAALPHISLLAAATTVSASANPSAALTVATLQPAMATASVSASRSTGLPFATLTAPNATASASSGVVANASLPHASLMAALASASGTLSATANTALPFATLQIASVLAGVSSLASASMPHAVLFPAQASSTISALTLTADDIQAIADAVWSHSQALQCHTLMTEVWGRLGLDPAKPLITGANQISFGAIVMTMAEISNQVTVTRQ